MIYSGQKTVFKMLSATGYSRVLFTLSDYSQLRRNIGC